MVEPDVKNKTNEKQSILTLEWILWWTWAYQTKRNKHKSNRCSHIL